MEQNEVFKFEFTFPEINVVLAGLKKLPWEQSAGIIQKMIATYEDQTRKEPKKEKQTDPEVVEVKK